MTGSFPYGGKPSNVRVDPSYVGWYVGAIDAPGALRTVPAMAYPQAPPADEATRTPPPSQAVAVSPLIGPVRPAG